MKAIVQHIQKNSLWFFHRFIEILSARASFYQTYYRDVDKR